MSRSKHSLDDAYERQIWEKFTLLWRRHCKGTEQGLSPRREGFQGIWIEDDGIMLKIIMIIVMQQRSPSMFLCCTDKWYIDNGQLKSYNHTCTLAGTWEYCETKFPPWLKMSLKDENSKNNFLQYWQTGSIFQGHRLTASKSYHWFPKIQINHRW